MQGPKLTHLTDCRRMKASFLPCFTHSGHCTFAGRVVRPVGGPLCMPLHVHVGVCKILPFCLSVLVSQAHKQPNIMGSHVLSDDPKEYGLSNPLHIT